jgi:translation initiation factor IF-3
MGPTSRPVPSAPGKGPTSRPIPNTGGGPSSRPTPSYGGGGGSRPTSRPSSSGPGGGRDRDRKGEKDPFNVNENIRAREVRVIGPDAKMLGVFPTSQALTMARDFGLDLIEVAPDAKPPTCKIMDYGKWKYENKKKAHANKKKQVIITLKEIQLRPRTDGHDLEVKMRHARRFLMEGDKVKINMRFQGREMAYNEIGRAMMRKVAASLLDIGLLESDPKQEGRQLFMIVAPDPVKMKEFRAKHPELFLKKTAKEQEIEQEELKRASKNDAHEDDDDSNDSESDSSADTDSTEE